MTEEITESMRKSEKEGREYLEKLRELSDIGNCAVMNCCAVIKKNDESYKKAVGYIKSATQIIQDLCNHQRKYMNGEELEYEKSKLRGIVSILYSDFRLAVRIQRDRRQEKFEHALKLLRDRRQVI